MIQTNKPIYPLRNGNLEVINLEIESIQDDFVNEVFKILIADFIFKNDQKNYINQRTINLSYKERDGLKTAIVSQLPSELTEGMCESEVNKFILPYALQYFVQNDKLENDKLIYNTEPSDWIIS